MVSSEISIRLGRKITLLPSLGLVTTESRQDDNKCVFEWVYQSSVQISYSCLSLFLVAA